MSSSSPRRTWCHIGVVSAIPLLALALGTGDAPARSLERTIGAGAGRRPAVRTSAGADTRRAGAAETRGAGTLGHDPCCAGDAPAPDPRAGAPATGSREGAAAGRAQPHARGKSADRPGGARVEKRSGDGRIAPHPAPVEQRRGGIGTLIGITFA